MENDFRYLSRKVSTNLDNLIKKLLFVSRPLRWHFATIYDVTTVLLCNGTVQKIHKFLLFMNIYLPPCFIFRYVRLKKMIVHGFMIELDQSDY